MTSSQANIVSAAIARRLLEKRDRGSIGGDRFIYGAVTVGRTTASLHRTERGYWVVRVSHTSSAGTVSRTPDRRLKPYATDKSLTNAIVRSEREVRGKVQTTAIPGVEP